MTTAAPAVLDARKREILEATWRLIAERGYHEVRVADIAAEVGTSTGTVHYHFPGKQDVLVEALRYCVERAFARQTAELRKLDDPRERLLRLIDMQLPRAGNIRDEWNVWAQFWAEAAQGIRFLGTRDEVERFVVSDQARVGAALDGPSYVLQEYVDGETHNVGGCVQDGTYVSLLTNKHLFERFEHGGPGIVHVTTEVPEIMESARLLAARFDWNGPLHFNFFLDPLRVMKAFGDVG